jgi:hypothetical protein
MGYNGMLRSGFLITRFVLFTGFFMMFSRILMWWTAAFS